MNFIDYEKAFNSVETKTLKTAEAPWNLREYLPLVWNVCHGMSCKVLHAGQMSVSFRVNTGVWRGFVLFLVLFLFAIYWIIKTSTAGRKNDIQTTVSTQLDDLAFGDNLVFLAHNDQLQGKTSLTHP